MARVTQCLVAPGISGRFIDGDDGWRLFSLEESESFNGKTLPVPGELREQRFPTYDEALFFVRGYLGSSKAPRRAVELQTDDARHQRRTP
jgi:hypothetical protein